jgi:tetratricopeptide (TPR) repeat protein
MSSETTESARGIEFLAWVETHKTRLLIGVAVVALLASGLALYRWRSAQLEMQANSALVQVQMRRSKPGETNSEPKADEYLEVARRYSSTGAGQRAQLLAAGALFREGKYAESQAIFEALHATRLGQDLEETAALGLAACLEAAGKTEEAISAYREVITEYADSAVAAQAKLALGGVLESKNELQQALGFYDQVLTTAWSSEAELRRQALLSRHPELAPPVTNAPAVSVPEISIPQAVED